MCDFGGLQWSCTLNLIVDDFKLFDVVGVLVFLRGSGFVGRASRCEALAC